MPRSSMANARRALAALAAVLLTSSCVAANPASTTSTPSATANPKADAVRRIVDEVMKQAHLKAAIVRVTVDGKEVITGAAGESMAGVPATPAMHFRNGAVAISYVSTLLLRLVDEKKLSLDDKLSKWLPAVPNSDRVTLGQLAQMTSGYVDYVIGNAPMNKALFADPFRHWTTKDLLDFAVNQPLLYDPGTNWNYAHTNYVLLGLAIEKATGEEMSNLLSEKVLQPLGLTETKNWDTPEIPSPVLHAYDSERRQFLGIPDGTPFYEDSTFWDPSWTITHGAIQTTNIYDLEATAVGIGSGKLLTPDSYAKMTSTALRGKTHAQPGCTTCLEQNIDYTYGLGIVITGNWLVQNPLLAGYAAVEGYLPSQKIAIAVATTFDPEAFGPDGDYPNSAQTLFQKIGAELAPDDAPPAPKPK